MTHPRQAHSTSRAEEGDAGARRLPLPPAVATLAVTSAATESGPGESPPWIPTGM
jgi:hypothetical protein